jgi:polysaccharide pyruvyl transferase WcaK-like protein
MQKEDNVGYPPASMGAEDQLPQEPIAVKNERPVRIALLTPYTGGNLGDAAIQDAFIANFRLRFPNARFSGISLNCDNYRERHGEKAFPLCGINIRNFGMAASAATVTDSSDRIASRQAPAAGGASVLKRVLRRIPGVRRVAKKLSALLARCRQEFDHWARGRDFLKEQDILVVSGGGQLDEAWGGSWGHPYALFKWAVLARMASIPFVMVSVGAGKTDAWLSRRFLSAAMRASRYRSYRDTNSRGIAANFARCASQDSVVPDLAFSLPIAALPLPADLQSLSGGRIVVAISPIAYRRPDSWPEENRELYDRYVRELSAATHWLLNRGYFVVMVWSALSDKKVISEVVSQLEERASEKLSRQLYVPALNSWSDLLALLKAADFLIASRLHSVILGFVANTPTVAISFDPKVDWVMQDLHQTDSLLHIQNFSAQDIVTALERIESRKDAIVKQIDFHRQETAKAFSLQYDFLMGLLQGEKSPANLS